MTKSNDFPGPPEAEATLQRMAALLEHTGQLAKVGGWELDLRSLKLSWTRETFRIAEIDSLVEPPLADGINLFAPEARPTIAAAVQAATDSGTPYDLELPILTAKGRHRWVRTQGYATMENGKAIVLRGTFQDITERKRAELFKNNEREILEFVARGGPLPEVLTRLVRCYEALFPGTRGSVLLLDASGRHLRHGAAPSLPPAFCQAIDGVAIGPSVGSCGTAAYEKRTTVAADIASDPRWHDFKELALTHGLRACWSVPILGDAGRVLGTFAFYYDEPRGALPSELAIIEGGAYLASLAIDRHQKTLARERNAERLALATRAGGVGIWEYDIAANRLVWDDQMYRLYGIAPDQFSGEYEAWRTGLHPDDVARADQEISRALAGENEFNTEFRVIWPDGTTHHIRALAIVQRAPDGQPRLMIGTNWDITDQKQAEEKQRQFERKMLDTQKLESLGVLAGGIAHDFNNLLTGILGNASLASLDLPTGSPIQDNLRAIQQGSLRAADLCRQMLAYSGKGRFVVNNLGLNRLIEDTTPLVQLSISKHAVLRFNLHRELPAIEADATQIRQVIMNLVINASEAIGEKSGVITLNTGLTRVDRAYLGGTILAPELPEGTYVYLEVSDSGCGMDAETQAKIFDPFYTTKFSGRGLGLAAVLGIVRGHKGVLKVYSEPGRGTTFKLLFPCAAGSESVLPERVEAKVLPGQGCILVVDDEETVRSTAALMLRKMGFEVALTNDGREAVAAFRAQPDRYRLVLTDLTMPHLDGEQVFTELRAIRAEVAVILMSGFNEEEASVRFTGKGLASFIQKPFEFGQLSKIVHGALAGSPRAN